jgi:two-component system, chemotaxis family, protein-glutamate methylesterase/glutaminase
MPDGTEREWPPVALTCPACGGPVEEAAGGGIPRFACRLGHRFAAAEMDEAQASETARVLEAALRMFKQRAELARRLAEAQRKRGRPVSAEHWEATTREMEDAAEVLRRLLERGWRADLEGDGGSAPDTGTT